MHFFSLNKLSEYIDDHFAASYPSIQHFLSCATSENLRSPATARHFADRLRFSRSSPAVNLRRSKRGIRKTDGISRGHQGVKGVCWGRHGRGRRGQGKRQRGRATTTAFPGIAGRVSLCLALAPASFPAWLALACPLETLLCIADALF